MRMSKALKREIKLWLPFVPAIIFITFVTFYIFTTISSYIQLLEYQNNELRDAMIYYLREEPKH